jgi:hypothetical protein
MKRCPFCAQKLQDDAHHCHHCSSMIVDMDGNPIAINQPDRLTRQRAEWIEKAIKVLVTVFFTVQFFIDGLIIMRMVFGTSIVTMNSGLSISANIILLVISVAGAMLISPIIINWVKQNFDRVIK